MGITTRITSIIVLVLMVLLHVLFAHGTELRTYEIERNCRLAETRDEPAGILRLDTDTIFDSYDYRRSCAVKVSPKQVPGGSYRDARVLFYFTEFDLPGTCSEFNISVVEGSSAYESPVQGTAKVMCGTNSTLTRPGMVFNTSRSEFTVILRWGRYTPSSPGHFVLKYSSYYNGPCQKGYEDEAVTCLNNRCVTSAYHCHAEIDTCGTGEEDACEMTLEEAMGWAESILDTVKNIGIIVAVIVFGFLALRVLRSCGFKPVERLRKLLGNGQQDENPNDVHIRSRSASFQTTELNQQIDTNATAEAANDQDSSSDESNSSINIHMSLESDNEPDLPPSYEKLSPVPTAPPHPDAAPPTYYDVMSDEEQYRYKQ